MKKTQPRGKLTWGTVWATIVAHLSFHAIRDCDLAEDGGRTSIWSRYPKTCQFTVDWDEFKYRQLQWAHIVAVYRIAVPLNASVNSWQSLEISRDDIRGNKATFHDRRRIAKHAYRRDETLEPIQEELAIVMQGHKVLLKTRSSYWSCWSFFPMTARSCICTPCHHTRVAGNSHEGLQCAQRLPVIQPEVVVVPAKDISAINTAAVDELNVLQPFGLTNLICWMIDPRSQIGCEGHSYKEPLDADVT